MTQTNLLPDDEPKVVNLPHLTTLSLLWALLSFILWMTGLLAISFLWIVAPALYVLHLHISYQLMVQATRKEIGDALDDVEMGIDQNVVTFHDVTDNMGALN